MERGRITHNSSSIGLEGYRWVIIIIFALNCLVNFFQFMQFSTIADSIEEYYGAGSFTVQMSGLVFMISFVALFVPVGYLVENMSLWKTSFISAVLTAIGNGMKLFATSPDSFWLIIVAQSLCAISQIFLLIIPSKVACTWFGAKEVSTACAIGLFGCNIGVALGAAVSGFMVTTNGNEDEVRKDLGELFTGNAAASVAILLIVILFFRSQPSLPPSQSQVELTSTGVDDKMTYWLAMKGFAKNKDFLIVLWSFGLAYGLYNTFALLINQIYKEFFPNEPNSELGILCFITIIAGGCFGSAIFGHILDRTDNFKKVALCVFLANLITTIGQSVAILMSYKIWAFIMISVNGFFNGSMMVIGYEYTIETTYPTPEAYGAAIFNVVIYLFAIFFVVLLDIVFDTLGYTVGLVIVSIAVGIATISLLWISPELRRRNANLKSIEEKS